MASVSSKIFEIFRYLKSDAVPKAPRQADAEPVDPIGPRVEPIDPTGPSVETETNDTPYNTREADESDHEEIIFTEDDFDKGTDFIKGEKQKFKFPFNTKKTKDPKDPNKKKSSKSNKGGGVNSVYTQATGPVFNFVNAEGIQVGSNHVYYMSAKNGTQKSTEEKPTDHIEKDNLITLLMEATNQPTHKYIHFVSNNLGKNWQSFYIALGYLKGRIETLEMEKGIIEARYKLLLEWADNEEGTLGRLATLLWEEGERQIVRELSLIYNENKK